MAAIMDLSAEVEQECVGASSDTSFSRQYLLAGDFAVASPQVEQLRRVLTHDVRTFLANDPGWSVVVSQGHMVVWRGDSWCQPDELAALTQRAVAVFRLFATKARQA
jgi:hypothetical protein